MIYFYEKILSRWKEKKMNQSIKKKNNSFSHKKKAMEDKAEIQFPFIGLKT